MHFYEHNKQRLQTLKKRWLVYNSVPFIVSIMQIIHQTRKSKKLCKAV